VRPFRVGVRRLSKTIGTRPIAQKTPRLENPEKNASAGFTGDYRTTSGQQYSLICRERTWQSEGFSVRCDVLCCDVLGPFLLRQRPIGNNVNGVGVCSLGRLRWLPIATIKQCARSRNSRSSWRFWIAHYLRKRLDGRSRIIAGGVLNVGQYFRSSVQISRLARFEACASRSPWHLPDIAC
jgi:hypothetical protein